MPTENEIAMVNAARAAGITSRDELANFMAQISHESGGLTRLEEGFRYTRSIDAIPVQSAFREGREALESARLEALDGRPQELARLMYGGRMGNDDAGDGYLYRGRGFIMLTGEDNYRARGNATGLDLVNNPDLATDRDNASRIAVSYWQDRVPQADRDDVSAATRAINGGENGLADRYNRFDAWHAQLTPEFLADLDAGRVLPGERVAPAAGLDATSDGILRRGETGPEVGQLQTDLRALGVRDNNNREIETNNDFGRSTEQAIRGFQEQAGLAVNGRAGPETLEAIQQALQRQRDQQPPSAPQRSDTEAPPAQNAGERGRLIDGDRPRGNEIPVGMPPDPGTPSIQNPVRSLGPHDARDPRDPTHPDHALYEQIREGVQRLDAQHGRTFDAASERMSMSLLALAKQNGISRVDDVAVNNRTPNLQAGELVFLVQGNRSDPAMQRESMPTAVAAQTPVNDSMQRIEVANQQMAQQSVREEALQHGEDPNRGPRVV